MNQRSYPVPFIAVALSARALRAPTPTPSPPQTEQPHTVRLAFTSSRREIMSVLHNRAAYPIRQDKLDPIAPTHSGPQSARNPAAQQSLALSYGVLSFGRRH